MSTEVNRENLSPNPSRAENHLLETRHEFADRHIGPSEFETREMLKFLGFSTLEEMATKVIPRSIRSKHDFRVLGQGLSEFATLQKLKNIMSKNQPTKSFIGLGYYDTITPSPILRNVF